MKMDNAGDLPEGGASDEAESPESWYFDLPTGAWERQEQKNRELRQRVLDNTAEKADRDPFARRKAESDPKRSGLFGFGRKKDEPPARESIGGTYRLARGGDPIPSPDQLASEGDDEWSTESFAVPPAAPAEPPLRVPRSGWGAPPPAQEPEADTSRWGGIFGHTGDNEGGLTAMSAWAKHAPQEEPPSEPESRVLSETGALDEPGPTDENPWNEQDGQDELNEPDGPTLAPEDDGPKSWAELRALRQAQHEAEAQQAAGAATSRWEAMFNVRPGEAGMAAPEDAEGDGDDPGAQPEGLAAMRAWLEKGPLIDEYEHPRRILAGDDDDDDDGVESEHHDAPRPIRPELLQPFDWEAESPAESPVARAIPPELLQPFDWEDEPPAEPAAPDPLPLGRGEFDGSSDHQTSGEFQATGWAVDEEEDPAGGGASLQLAPTEEAGIDDASEGAFDLPLPPAAEATDAEATNEDHPEDSLALFGSLDEPAIEAVAPMIEQPAPRKRGFFGRLFGRGDVSPALPAPDAGDQTSPEWLEVGDEGESSDFRTVASDLGPGADASDSATIAMSEVSQQGEWTAEEALDVATTADKPWRWPEPAPTGDSVTEAEQPAAEWQPFGAAQAENTEPAWNWQSADATSTAEDARGDGDEPEGWAPEPFQEAVTASAGDQVAPADEIAAEWAEPELESEFEAFAPEPVEQSLFDAEPVVRDEAAWEADSPTEASAAEDEPASAWSWDLDDSDDAPAFASEPEAALDGSDDPDAIAWVPSDEADGEAPVAAWLASSGPIASADAGFDTLQAEVFPAETDSFDAEVEIRDETAWTADPPTEAPAAKDEPAAAWTWDLEDSDDAPAFATEPADAPAASDASDAIAGLPSDEAAGDAPVGAWLASADADEPADEPMDAAGNVPAPDTSEGPWANVAQLGDEGGGAAAPEDGESGATDEPWAAVDSIERASGEEPAIGSWEAATEQPLEDRDPHDAADESPPQAFGSPPRDDPWAEFIARREREVAEEERAAEQWNDVFGTAPQGKSDAEAGDGHQPSAATLSAELNGFRSFESANDEDSATPPAGGQDEDDPWAAIAAASGYDAATPSGMAVYREGADDGPSEDLEESPANSWLRRAEESGRSNVPWPQAFGESSATDEPSASNSDTGWEADEAGLTPDEFIVRAFERKAAEPLPEERAPSSGAFAENDEGVAGLLGDEGEAIMRETAEYEAGPRSFARVSAWAPQHPGRRIENPNEAPWESDDPGAEDDFAGVGIGGPSYTPSDADGPPPSPFVRELSGGYDPVPALAPARHTRTKTLVREVVETGLLALLVFLSVRASFQNFKVDGSSMYPTLQSGQFLIVNKLEYSQVDMAKLSNFLPFVDPGSHPKRNVFHPPERGDIVVLQDPRKPDTDLIKRVIALPGETVQIVNGKVYINDHLLIEPYIKSPWHDTKQKITIPEGQYYVLGDNRDNSLDSRSTQVGLVPEDLIIGKATLSYWPLDRFGLAPNQGGDISLKDGPPSLAAETISGR